MIILRPASVPAVTWMSCVSPPADSVPPHSWELNSVLVQWAFLPRSGPGFLMLQIFPCGPGVEVLQLKPGFSNPCSLPCARGRSRKRSLPPPLACFSEGVTNPTLLVGGLGCILSGFECCLCVCVCLHVCFVDTLTFHLMF